jgi:ectoine hydroxylase-related dioxygenase (phytanoyl-CoA dioxygenase family)
MDRSVRLGDVRGPMSQAAAGTADMVAAEFAEHGGLILQQIFPPSLIATLHEAYRNRYGEMTVDEMEARCEEPGATEFFRVGGLRYDIAPTMTPPFNDPRIFAHEGILSVLGLLLGNGYKVNSFTIVVSYPGADMQHVHRDDFHLFERENVGRELPPHAVNLAIPLVDIDLEVGATAFWPGSHRWEAGAPCADDQMVEPELRTGDCMIIDYRTIHAGMPNRSARVRPVLYVVYARSWFFDEKNFTNRHPLDLPEDEYAKLAPDLQELMSRSARNRLLRR